MRYLALDGLRGISAIMVVLYHLNVFGTFEEILLTRGGFLFVDFFFVLSGFVISHTWSTKIRNWKDVIAFVIRRFGRLWPLHISTLFVLVVIEWLKRAGASVEPFSGSNSPSALIYNVALLHSMGLLHSLTWNFPSWSISAEFYTYILFALVCLFTRNRYLLALSIALVSLYVLFRSAASMDVTYDFGLIRCFYGFFLGTIAYAIHKRSHSAESTVNHTVAEIVVISLAVVFVSYTHKTSLSLLAPFIFMTVTLVFSYERGYLSRLMKSRPFAYLGEISYSIYLIHVILLIGLDKVANATERATGKTTHLVRLTSDGTREFVDFGSPMINILAILLYFFILILMSRFSFNVIEAPCRNFFNKVSRRI